MTSRSRRVQLSNGVAFETPLLVPAVSSRALGPIDVEQMPGRKPQPVACSVVHTDLLLAGIDWALLISAYDISHNLLSDAKSFKRRFSRSRYAAPRVLIIDSGWYEKGAGTQASAFMEGLNQPLKWERGLYEKVLDGLDPELKAIAVSWDGESSEAESGRHSSDAGSYSEQIASAQRFFGARPRFASTILLKRPSAARFHHIEKLSEEDAGRLRAFDIVGVTEKELGDTVVNRLLALARLRTRLDDANVSAPIHVFGGLDPLFTPLYFAAGAEVFDGLGWLRYAYREGLAVNREDGAILDEQLTKRWEPTLNMISLQNLDVIRNLTDDLRIFAHHDGDWSKISPRGELLRPVHERLLERLRDKGSGGGHGE